MKAGVKNISSLTATSRRYQEEFFLVQKNQTNKINEVESSRDIREDESGLYLGNQ
jgi:hypothetical protein